MALQEGYEKCGNAACHCTVGPGLQYCSPHCEAEAAAAGKSARECGCGHAACLHART